ncbi:MAG: nickel pincer cofactor biosynthesis protein LarB [Candidatus Geothermincolia bacterium]
MKRAELERLLEQVRDGGASIEDAVGQIARLPFSELGFAKLDHHRELRKGFPEVVFCQGKSLAHIGPIAEHLAKSHSGNILFTRVEPEQAAIIREACPEAEYDEESRTVCLRRGPQEEPVGEIAVITGGTADFGVAEEARITAELMGNRVTPLYDVGVSGVHRLVHFLPELQRANVIVAVAGMDGALPSIVGGLVGCPVIAVPTSQGYGASFGGVAALLSMLNSCSTGVSVVNIDNGFGAAFTASLINRQSAEER